MHKKHYRILSMITACILICSSCASLYSYGYREPVFALDQEKPIERTEDSDEEPESSGDSTEDIITKDVYSIQNEDDFMQFTENCRLDEWSLNRKIRLMADLDLSGSRYADFDGISSFSGYFDGHGHTISGVRLTGGTEAVGLFHYLEQEGTIDDLNVRVNLSSDNSADILGGIVGVNSGTIKNCSFEGNIAANGTTGGIAGYNGSTGAIESCRATGTIKSSHTVGGMVGENRGIISDSINQSDVNSDSSWFEEDSGSSITMSLSGLIDSGTELILNGTDIGGIAGYNDGIIAGCKNTSTVGYLHTGRNIGGIVGRQSGDVINCKNTGMVYGKQDVGGIVGLMEPALTYEDAEKLNEEVDGLHDDIEKLINDMDAMGNSIHSDLNDMSYHAENAENSADAITTELRDVIETDVDVVNDLSSRLTYVINHMPEVMDYMDQALNSMEALGKDFAKIRDDVDIESKMENETHDPAKNHRLTLTSGIGGTITCGNLNPAEGVTVDIKIQPEDGYSLSDLIYQPYGGTETSVIDHVSEDTYSFSMPAENVTIKAAFAYRGDYIAASNAGGRIELEQSKDKVRIRAIPYGGYELSEVTVDGKDITGSFADDNGVLTAEIEKAAVSKPVLVQGTFVKSLSAHLITVESSTGGTVTSDPVSAASGDTVTLNVSAVRNYTIDSLTAVDSHGTNIPVTASGENAYTFTMPDDRVMVQALFAYIPDTDTTIYTESTVGGVVEAIPNLTNNDYYITMNAASGYEVSGDGVVLEIYENGAAAPARQLNRAELEEFSNGYRYTLNTMNYEAPIRVMGYYTELREATHLVSVTSGTGGTVTCDQVRASGGGEIKIAVTHDTGYTLSSLIVNGEEISSGVSDGIVTWKVPEDLNGDIEIVGTFSPVMLVITSDGVGGNAYYSVSGDQVTITVNPDSGYIVTEPLDLKDSDGTDILYQKQYANSNIYVFTVTDAMKQGNPAYLSLGFQLMDDKATVEDAKNHLTEDSANFSNSLEQVSATTDQIRELMTDDFGEVRSAEDLSEEELDRLQELLLELSDELGDAGTYASSILRSLTTIVDVAGPYIEDAIDALQEDLELFNNDYQNMVHAFQGASAETRAIVDYLNALEELKFKNLSSDFDSNSERLSVELNTILDIMRRLNDHIDQYSESIETDMRAVNDRLNTIFDMILIKMDNLENMTDGKDLLEDHSADEEQIYETSRITSCSNYGNINGDINIGGITGSIGREVDETENDSGSTNKIGAKYIVSAIVYDCSNEGFITVKTENGGGIAGNMSIGLIRKSFSEGSVTSDDGRCLGGIAGYSTGTIRECGSKSELSGGEFLGGIAGKANVIKDCRSMVYILDSVARVGAIAAAYIPNEDASDDMTVYRKNLKHDFEHNYYVSNDLYGMDGVSYVSVAEPLSYSDFMQLENVDRAFKNMKVTFVDEENQVIDTFSKPYGTMLASVEFPQIQTDSGDYYEWDGPESDSIESNMIFRAVVTANVTVLQSTQKYNHKSYALAEGTYTESTVMNVEESDLKAPETLPANAITHVEHVVIENSSLKDQDETRLRLLNVEEIDNSTVYAYRNGGWKKLKQIDAGNYIQVTMIGTDETFCIVSVPHSVNIRLIGWIGGGVLIAGGLAALIMMTLRRRRKTG